MSHMHANTCEGQRTQVRSYDTFLTVYIECFVFQNYPEITDNFYPYRGHPLVIGKWIYLLVFMNPSLLHARTKVMGNFVGIRSCAACEHIHKEILMDGQVRTMRGDKGSQLSVTFDLLCGDSDPRLHLQLPESTNTNTGHSIYISDQQQNSVSHCILSINTKLREMNSKIQMFEMKPRKSLQLH